MWKTFWRHCFLAQRHVVGANVHDHRVLGLGQIGDGKEIGSFEVGDDQRVAVLEDLLRLGDDVAVGRHDGLDELEGIADEIAGLVRFLDGDARALNALVGDDLLGIGERQRLVILLAEIDDGQRDLRRGRGGVGGRCRSLRRCGGAGRRCGSAALGGMSEDWACDQAEGEEGRPDTGWQLGVTTQACDWYTRHGPGLLHFLLWPRRLNRRPWTPPYRDRRRSPVLERYLPELWTDGNAQRTTWQRFCQVKQWQP